MTDYHRLTHDEPTRRRFLARMSAAGLGAAAASLFVGPAGALAAPAPPRKSPPPPSLTASSSADDRDDNATTGPSARFPGIPGRNINEVVLNFALTLEILEADLYRQALNVASGRDVEAALSSNPGVYKNQASRGGFTADQAADAFLYLKQFTYIEAAHRDFLRAAITAGGGKPVAANPDGYRFPGGLKKDLRAILTAILPLEETGVRAYLGALPYLTDLNLATVAAGIFSTEARHSAVVAYTLGLDPGPRMQPGDKTVITDTPDYNTLEYYLPPGTVLQRVKPLLG